MGIPFDTRTGLEVIDDFMAGYDYDNPVADTFKNIKKILES